MVEMNYTRTEIILRESSVRLKAVEETDRRGRFLAVPFGLRSLPLMVWATEKGFRVVTEDPWEIWSVNNQPIRDEDTPENVTVATLSRIDFVTDEFPVGMTVFLPEQDVNSLPQLREPDDDVRWDCVEMVRLTYKLTHASGTEQIVVKPDYFIFEDKNGRYDLFYQEDADIHTAALLDSALEAIVRAEQQFYEFRDRKEYDEEWFEEYRITELRVNAALAAGDMKMASLIARNHFGVTGKEEL